MEIGKYVPLARVVSKEVSSGCEYIKTTVGTVTRHRDGRITCDCGASALFQECPCREAVRLSDYLSKKGLQLYSDHGQPFEIKVGSDILQNACLVTVIKTE